jgi:hypothetical protein
MRYEHFRARVPEGVSGAWRVEQFEVTPDGAALNLIVEGSYVPPDSYTRLLRGSTTVMSDTPDEWLDHREFIRQAQGRVLVNGLGLGCALGAILDKREVMQVDVVEASEEVLLLSGPTFDRDPRVNLIHADAFEQAKAWPVGSTWDVVWHDIWSTVSTEDLDEHAALLRSYGKRARSWQGAWKHERLQYLDRKGWWR